MCTSEAVKLSLDFPVFTGHIPLSHSPFLETSLPRYFLKQRQFFLLRETLLQAVKVIFSLTCLSLKINVIYSSVTDIYAEIIAHSSYYMWSKLGLLFEWSEERK